MHRSRSALRKHLASIPAAALILETEGRITAVNESASNLIDRPELDGAHFATLFESESADAVDRFLRALHEPGAAAEMQGRLVADPSRHLLARATRQNTDDHAVCILIDVSSLVERSEQLEIARARADEVARSKTEFLGRLSHEIRSALASMIGVADMLRDQTDEEKQELAEIITLSGRHLLETLKSVMDLSRLEFAEADLEVSPVDVVDRVRERIIVLQPLARKKGIELVFRPEADHAVGQLNRTLLDRVIHNLVDNAIRYTEEGKVEASVETRDGAIWIYVADTGIGIDPSFLPRLFEPFEREKRGGAFSDEGVGLGLAITRYLVESMNGQIYVCSTKDSGTTFTVRFPDQPDPGRRDE